MAVVGIVMKFFQIVISIVVAGTAAGCIPLLSASIMGKVKRSVSKSCLQSCWDFRRPLLALLVSLLLVLSQTAYLLFFVQRMKVFMVPEFALKSSGICV